MTRLFLVMCYHTSDHTCKMIAADIQHHSFDKNIPSHQPVCRQKLDFDNTAFNCIDKQFSIFLEKIDETENPSFSSKSPKTNLGLIGILFGIYIGGFVYNPKKHSIAWISDWLNNRTPVVGVNGRTLTEFVVGSDVPRGSVLGPLLFLTYINDMIE